jgi:hypothetical protein
MTPGEPRARVVLAAIHPVRDFPSWREVVREHSLRNPSPGVVRRTIYQSADDPNEVLVLVEFETEEQAHAVVPSFGMRELLDKAGVDIYPAVFVGHEVEDLTIESDLPS